jgi:hypothetical protein
MRFSSARAALAFVLPMVACSCGYRPLYGGEGFERLGVVSASPLVADTGVVAAVEAGVRAGLARAGGLREGTGYPHAVFEVLRIDAASEGMAAANGLGAQPGSSGPLARGTRIGVVARAWVERTPDGPRERDTGDVRAVELMAVEGDARLEALRRDDALRAAARRLGERLARRLLGEPDAPDDGM